MLGGLAAAVLGGGAFALIRARKRRQNAEDANSSFLESNFTPDSFFNASGGKDVDTSETTTTSSGNTDANQSSMLYSPSQLDAEADVDPVSEADVYLAYGRDIQAEEILKDALLKHPGRIPVYSKLLEIYARRRDTKGYAQTANELRQLTNATGAEWDAACAKGAEIDPGNPLYAESASAIAAVTLPPATASAPRPAPAPAQIQPAVAALTPASVAPAAAATLAPVTQAPTVRNDLLQQPA